MLRLQLDLEELRGGVEFFFDGSPPRSHDLRHTFATRLGRAIVPVRAPHFSFESCGSSHEYFLSLDLLLQLEQSIEQRSRASCSRPSSTVSPGAYFRYHQHNTNGQNVRRRDKLFR